MYKSYSVDKFLYHYRTAETARDHILSPEKLRFSPYDQTNDPYETKNWSITIKDHLAEIQKAKEKDKKFVTDLIIKFYDKRSLYINKIKSQIRVLCFSEDDKSVTSINNFESFGLKLGWGYPRMWAQYGTNKKENNKSNHNGVCLMFEKKTLGVAIEDEFSKDFLIYKGKIKYTDDLIDRNLNEIDFNIVKSVGIENALKNRIYNNIEGFFFKKAEDWQNEREFRYILVPKKEIKEDYLHISISESLKVIILGCEIEKSIEKKIVKIAKRIKVRVYKMDWDYSIPMIFNAPYQPWSDNLPNPF